jgi:hypothetical protein
MPMKGLALTALGLVTACGAPDLGAGPADASGDVRDASGGPDEASRGPDGTTRDASDTGDGSAVGDATVPGEAGPSAECAGESVPPSTLSCTGLYADIVSKTLASGVRPYQPAVPLWSDNAQKARWIQLPPGTQIDASNPSEWTFPVGTKVWKEFSKNGKRVETRLFQKVDSGPPSYWVHATYAWNADESAAITSGGGDFALEGDGGTYHIPTFAECEECHNGRTDHILGFEQISLGLDGAQGLTLAELTSEGLLAPPPAQTKLVIGDDGTGAAAPALAWLHINCGVTCHNANSTATAFGVGMRLRLDPALLDGRQVTSAFDPLMTTIDVPAVSPGWIQPVQWTRIVAGNPGQSLLVQLISNRGTSNPVRGQMPPIATSIVDVVDVANVVDWVGKMPSPEDAGLVDASIDASDAAPVGDAATSPDSQ